MLSTGVGKHLWYSLNFICYISYVAACVHVHSRGALGLTTPSQPSSCCFQTQTTRRAGFTSSSGPWLLPWRQEPLWQEVWRLYSVRLTNFINVNNHWIGYTLVQGHPWRVGLVQVLRKQHHRWWERLCIISDSSEIMEGCKKSKRLSDTTQIKTTDRLTSLNSLLCSGHRVLFAREKYEGGCSSGCGSRREYRQTIFYSSRAALPSPSAEFVPFLPVERKLPSCIRLRNYLDSKMSLVQDVFATFTLAICLWQFQ